MQQQRLTATEARVAGLVSAGHTNREIAAALRLQSKMVEQHLARICTKLGLQSRTELAFLFGTANAHTDFLDDVNQPLALHGTAAEAARRSRLKGDS